MKEKIIDFTKYFGSVLIYFSFCVMNIYYAVANSSFFWCTFVFILCFLNFTFWLTIFMFFPSLIMFRKITGTPDYPPMKLENLFSLFHFNYSKSLLLSQYNIILKIIFLPIVLLIFIAELIANIVTVLFYLYLLIIFKLFFFLNPIINGIKTSRYAPMFIYNSIVILASIVEIIITIVFICKR